MKCSMLRETPLTVGREIQSTVGSYEAKRQFSCSLQVKSETTPSNGGELLLPIQFLPDVS